MTVADIAVLPHANTAGPSCAGLDEPRLRCTKSRELIDATEAVTGEYMGTSGQLPRQTVDRLTAAHSQPGDTAYCSPA